MPFQFDRFTLDPADRQLRRDGAPVDLSARYLDALILLVREDGRLVSKDRFLEVVWQGVPVTDEALTQCIKTLRRALGDDAASPRFIETVPKHGYRFIAPVTDGAGRAIPVTIRAPAPLWPLGGAAAMGGGFAGLFGGIFYGFGGAPAEPQMGAISVLLVLICLNILVGFLGGAGIGVGIAAAKRATAGAGWIIAGGAGGGLLVGALFKLVGMDTFALLLGHAPADITGASEGLLLGGATGLGAWLALRAGVSRRRGVTGAMLAGGAAGALIPLLGGHLMGGSLTMLARGFPDSRLRLDQIGRLFGERDFGPVTQAVTGAVEGALFAGCVVAAMLLANATRGAETPRALTPLRAD